MRTCPLSGIYTESEAMPEGYRGREDGGHDLMRRTIHLYLLCYRKQAVVLRVRNAPRSTPADQRPHVCRRGSSSRRMRSLIERKRSCSSISVTPVKGSSTTKLRWVAPALLPIALIMSLCLRQHTPVEEKLSCYNEITPALT